MLSTLPSILNRPPVPAVDGALGRVAREPREPREAHTGFAALLQQQADLRAAALRNIDLQAAAAGRPALQALPPRAPPPAVPVAPAQPIAAAAAGGARSAATATPAKATEPAPRNAQAADQAADQASPARADDTSPASRSPARPGAAAGATRAAQPAAAAPTDADAAAEQAAAADRTAAPAGDQATLLASRSRLAARTQAGEATALARPRAGGGAGLAKAEDRAVDSGAVNTDAAGSDAADMVQPANAAGPDASQVPAWLQGQALVTGWRPAPVPAPLATAAAAPLVPPAQADTPALPAGPAAAPAAAPGAASAGGLTAATPSLARQPGPITDAAQLPAAATSRKTPATLPTSTTPALPKGLPELTIDTQPAGLAAGVAAAQTALTGDAAIAHTSATVAAADPGTAPPTPSVTGTGTGTTDANTTTRKSATTAQDQRRAAGPDAAFERATAAGTAPPFGADPAVDGGASGLTLDAATAASATDGGPAVAPPTRPIAEASAAPGGHEGDGSRTPIGAASNAVRSRPAANEAGVAAATQLEAPGAGDTTTATTAAAVVSSALTMALAGTALAGPPGEGSAAPRLPGDSERNPGRASRLPPVADPSLPGAAALPAPRSQGPVDLRAQAEPLVTNGAPDRPHSSEDRPAPSATTALPTAAAQATQATQAAQAAQADLRASAAGVNTVPPIEPDAAWMAAAVSGSAAAPALSANALATTAPRQAEATIAAPLTSPAFAPALGAQISLFTRDGVQTARLQLNPAEMGPITVQIALDGSAARVDFQADMASTRALIEASLPALAGALQEAGMTLAGGGVSQQPSSHQPPPQAEQPGGPRRGEDRPTANAAQPLPTRVHTGSRGLVDLVA